jgi:hypothetical protein
VRVWRFFVARHASGVACSCTRRHTKACCTAEVERARCTARGACAEVDCAVAPVRVLCTGEGAGVWSIEGGACSNVYFCRRGGAGVAPALGEGEGRAGGGGECAVWASIVCGGADRPAWNTVHVGCVRVVCACRTGEAACHKRRIGMLRCSYAHGGNITVITSVAWRAGVEREFAVRAVFAAEAPRSSRRRGRAKGVGEEISAQCVPAPAKPNKTTQIHRKSHNQYQEAKYM